jgi:hypothetical protein
MKVLTPSRGFGIIGGKCTRDCGVRWRVARKDVGLESMYSGNMYLWDTATKIVGQWLCPNLSEPCYSYLSD